jgi:hypothetical protein
MKNAKKLTGTMLATAAAALFVTGCASTNESQSGAASGSASAAQVKCVGVNSCKGRSSCKTGASSCKGLNACKGQGHVLLDAATCGHVGGTAS